MITTSAHQGCKTRKGPTSFWMQDPNRVFRELNLKRGESFLDLGCGIGDYSLEALKYVGQKGTVYSVDINERSLNFLKRERELRDLDNLFPMLGDATDSLDLEDGSVDSCLVSTVLHCMDKDTIAKQVMPELRRIIKKEGVLAILECNKERTDFGPPEHLRLSAEELEEMAAPYGFTRKGFINLGHNYLLRLSANEDLQ
ncbi:MAG: methyltransferase domain-containing protein [Spirochaetales bacterium]|nr:methyltransferase domain-containing protein [Spirochaetales bacterium]